MIAQLPDLEVNVAVEPMTARELEILRLMADGLTNREIARELVLSPETVKWYNKQAFSKLDVSNRTQAVARAREQGLLDRSGGSPAESVKTPRHTLPAELSTFVGREREIAEVKTMMQEARLVTLTGPGGTGKTRLALRVARAEVETYADGVVFVSLATVSSPALVADNIAQEVGVFGQAGRSVIDALKRYFRDKQLLLVLDNFEHVLAAAPLVTELLAAASRLHVLATSRESLSLTGEHNYPVPPLSVPVRILGGSAAELSAYESVALFVQRAQAVAAGFALTDENGSAVAGICAHLDGLPLAIELAAARTKLCNPQQLLERLESRLGLLTGGSRDLPDRQRTLRATIDWSYDLLGQDERQLFTRLAVFSNGSSLDAIEATCAPGLTVDVLDGLQSLLDKSLINQVDGPGRQPRVQMLQTIREYALGRLGESGETRRLRDRHLAYFLSLVEEMEPGFRRHGQLLLLAQAAAEFANFQAALEWAMARRNVAAAARLVSAVDYFLVYSHHLAEGCGWIERIMAEAGDISPDLRLRLLLAAGRLFRKNLELARGVQYSQEGLALARQLGDRRNQAWLLVELAIVSDDQGGDYTRCVELCEKGSAIFRQLDDKPGIAYAANVLGELCRAAGDYDKAREAYDESLAASRESGEIFRQVLLLMNQTFIAYHDRKFQQAKELAEEHLRQMAEISMKKPCDALSLAALAGPLGQLGRPKKAATLLGASEALMEGMGASIQQIDQHEKEKFIADIRSKIDPIAFETAWRKGRSMTLEQAAAYALAE